MRSLFKVLPRICANYDSWQTRSRKLHTHAIINILLQKLALRSVRRVCRPHDTSGKANISPPAVSKALRKIPPSYIQRIAQEMHSRYHLSSSRQKPILALDATKLPLPPCFREHGYRTYHRRTLPTYLRGRSRIRGMLTALVDVQSQCPVDWVLTDHFDERRAALPLLQSLSPGTTVLCDRGYFSTQFTRVAYWSGVRLMARLKTYPHRELTGLMHWLSRQQYPRTISTVFDAAGQIPVDMTRYDIRGKQYFCLIIRPKYPCGHPTQRRIVHQPDAVQRLYAKRWSVETVFRLLKSTLGLRDVRTTSPLVMQHEISARCLAVILHTVLTRRSTASGMQHSDFHTFDTVARLLFLREPLSCCGVWT